MRILITGGTGMVGNGFKNLKSHHELILVGRRDANLLDPVETHKLFMDKKPDAVIHLAAKVGGIKGNSDKVSDFYCENIRINTNVLNTAVSFKIKNLVSLLSTCVYPNKASYPLTEDQLHKGEPHQSNFGYAYAKRMLEVHSRAIRSQHGFKYTTAIPNNLYGTNDNFDLENGHVIPAIIRKIYEAKDSKTPPVFWGTGRALREFTYSDDISRALIYLVENYDGPNPVNIGKTGETSIWTTVRKVCKILKYEGDVFWDKEKPEGQYRKPSLNDKFLKICPDFVYTSFDDGLEKTCKWFVDNYPNVRGIN